LSQELSNYWANTADLEERFVEARDIPEDAFRDRMGYPNKAKRSSRSHRAIPLHERTMLRDRSDTRADLCEIEQAVTEEVLRESVRGGSFQGPPQAIR
jgi:hypothetical protein